MAAYYFGKVNVWVRFPDSAPFSNVFDSSLLLICKEKEGYETWKMGKKTL